MGEVVPPVGEHSGRPRGIEAATTGVQEPMAGGPVSTATINAAERHGAGTAWERWGTSGGR